MIEVLVVATSDLPSVELEFAVRTYRERFGEHLRISQSTDRLDMTKFPYRMTIFGKQYLADAILRSGMEKRRLDQVVIVLTSEDIYTRGMNYIFGLATARAALVSSARINPGFWKGFEDIFRYTKEGRPFFEKQYTKVLVHELGHALGLPHCRRWSCAMRYSNSPFELYRKGDDYCESCWDRFLLILEREESKRKYIV